MIQVTTHVARDLLQSSAYFNSVPKVVWEYVSNSLDNPRGNQPVHCRVSIGNGQVIVEDDARGMGLDDLRRFFTMHGENLQRAAGKTVRGRFGTGKSAAFGIGGSLQVDTVKDGLRNVVELRRADIEAAREGRPFDVRHSIVDDAVNAPPGTVVTIEGITTKASDIDQCIRYVEKRLGRFRQSHFVVVNNHPVEHEEPPFTDERRFALTDSPVAAGSPNGVELVVRVTPTPMDSDACGVDILSNGIWHELTVAGLEKSDHIEYLYGQVDVPALENDSGSISAFDNTRSGRLNPANPLVTELYAWIATCLEEVRVELVERDRERRRSTEAIRLQQDADRIAKILNSDFDQWRSDFRRAAGRLGKDLGHLVNVGDEPGEILPGDGDEQSAYVMGGPEPGLGKRGSGPGPGGDVERPGSGLLPGDGRGSASGGDGRERRPRSGGFVIQYENATGDEERSRYDEERRVIFINLDHPQIAAAKSLGIDSRPFRQLSYEVAFAEYALALPMDMARAQGAIFDAQDAIFEARLTLSRITRHAAVLYAGDGTGGA